MKRMFVLAIPVLLLFSCKKENTFPQVETITRGSKWNLRIGSSSADVYTQLQQLGKEKDFYDVAVNQQPVSSLQEIQHRFEFYHAITLETKTGALDRVIIQLGQDKINSIEAGGALPDEIPKWPQNASDNMAIKKGDPITGIYDKLLAIYKMPAYGNYRIILSDKPLDKPFDPNMVNYEEWGFSFFVDVKPGKSGRFSVILNFKNGELNKITNEYSEFDVYN
ncbi:MAG TPA: hypothetical protein VK609_18715 [Mucilaginibacter sp.]|nr:hypothetical protein [Mucilaginibacter sp.]